MSLDTCVISEDKFLEIELIDPMVCAFLIFTNIAKLPLIRVVPIYASPGKYTSNVLNQLHQFNVLSNFRIFFNLII